ncbi:MAG: tetratricopeptide repeat protein [Cyanobacteria bacterium REEB65]|nr:tetratricopeptide repeat protein [Cyanobacteria bacterium REEB65]
MITGRPDLSEPAAPLEDGAAALAKAREALRVRAFGQAEALAQSALDAGLQESPTYYLLAACAAATHRYGLAIDLARVGIALDPDPTSALGQLASLLLKQGRSAEAIAAIEGIDPDRRDRQVRQTLGLAYAAAGRPDAARATFRRVLEDDPSDALAKRALAALRPPMLDRVLEEIQAGLHDELAVIFARMRLGPATEAELETVLREAGYRRVLLKALLRDLAARTLVGSVPLVRIGPERVALDTAILDARSPGGAGQAISCKEERSP